LPFIWWLCWTGTYAAARVASSASTRCRWKAECHILPPRRHGPAGGSRSNAARDEPSPGNLRPSRLGEPSGIDLPPKPRSGPYYACPRRLGSPPCGRRASHHTPPATCGDDRAGFDTVTFDGVSRAGNGMPILLPGAERPGPGATYDAESRCCFRANGALPNAETKQAAAPRSGAWLPLSASVGQPRIGRPRSGAYIATSRRRPGRLASGRTDTAFPFPRIAAVT
jgi:hypothetical protein